MLDKLEVALAVPCKCRWTRIEATRLAKTWI
jgi:hypothetical protein